MKLRKSILFVVAISIVLNSNNVAFAATNKTQEPVMEEVMGKTEINLVGKNSKALQEVLGRNGIEYSPEKEYQKLVIYEQADIAGNYKYKGQKYRIVYQYYNMPVKQVKKQKFKHWSAVNKGFNIVIGFSKPYVWIPATILGIDFSKLEDPGPSSYVMTTIYTHVTEKCYQFVTKGHKSNDWANYGICRKASIEDTTIAYRLTNKKLSKYTSTVVKKTTVRKTAHYDDKQYMLKKSYEYWKNSYPGYQEYIN